MPSPNQNREDHETDRFFYLLLHLFIPVLSGTAQKVSYSARGASLKQAFSAVEKQTGYVVFANEQFFKAAGPVSVKAENMPLQDFLNALLKDQPLEYVIQGKTIVLS